jgi:hypothetical protein
MDFCCPFIFTKTLMMRITTSLCILLFFVSVSCQTSRYSSVGKADQSKIILTEKKDAIDFASLKQQSVTSFQQRYQARALLAPMAGSLISLGTDAVKKMIANDQKKYTAEYKMGLSDLVFYDQLSTESAFDPIGMQFNGFTLVRTFKNSAGSTDTAMVAEFELDKTNPYEILNNSIFRLKLKRFTLNSAKAKVAKNGPQTLNMDFEISFKTSYVNDQGVLFDNVTLGKFVFLLRDAPLNKTAQGYTAYYEKLAGKKIEGRSFIVPRSFGYYINEDGVPAKSFSQGAYSIQVNVKESSKNSFVNTLLIDNSGQIINAAGDKLKGFTAPKEGKKKN